MSEALGHYAAAAELQPEGPAAYFSKAVALANHGESADAMHAVGEEVRLHRDLGPAQLGIQVRHPADDARVLRRAEEEGRRRG